MEELNCQDVGVTESKMHNCQSLDLKLPEYYILLRDNPNDRS